jgi:putative sterol carrier protein
MSDTPSAAEVAENLKQVGPEDFAKLMAEADDAMLSELMTGPARKQVLNEIFNRMAEHVEPERIQGTNAICHFKILDRPEELGGGYDHYEVVFEDGRCTATDGPERQPQVTIKVKPNDFLKLASNQASGPVLFMTGKLKLEGDVLLASRLTSFFRIPTASS